MEVNAKHFDTPHIEVSVEQNCIIMLDDEQYAIYMDILGISEDPKVEQNHVITTKRWRDVRNPSVI